MPKPVHVSIDCLKAIDEYDKHKDYTPKGFIKSEWQPIESAPKDGNAYLGGYFGAYGDWCVQAIWYVAGEWRTACLSVSPVAKAQYWVMIPEQPERN